MKNKNYNWNNLYSRYNKIVKIIYDEKDPTNMKVDNSYSDKKTAIVLGIIAFLIFLNIYVDKRKKRKAKEKIEKEKSKWYKIHFK